MLGLILLALMQIEFRNGGELLFVCYERVDNDMFSDPPVIRCGDAPPDLIFAGGFE